MKNIADVPASEPAPWTLPMSAPEMREMDLSKREFLQAHPLAGLAALSFSPSPSTRAAEGSAAGSSTAAPRLRIRKVALQEHVMLPEFVDYFGVNREAIRPEMCEKALPLLAYFGSQRLELMDQNGIASQWISSAAISEDERAKVCYLDAERILGLTSM